MKFPTKEEISDFRSNIDDWTFGPANPILHQFLEQLQNDLSKYQSILPNSQVSKKKQKGMTSFIKVLRSKDKLQQMAIFLNRNSQDKHVDPRFDKKDVLENMILRWKKQKSKLQIVCIPILVLFVFGAILSFQFENALSIKISFMCNGAIWLGIYLYFARILWRCPACDYVFPLYEQGNPTSTSSVKVCPMCFVPLKN